VTDLSQRAGISEDEAAEVLSKVVPEFVNRVTPDGKVPSDEELSAAMARLSAQSS
jgi:uncharacterized protein YidB (DUF937 family)